MHKAIILTIIIFGFFSIEAKEFWEILDKYTYEYTHQNLVSFSEDTFAISTYFNGNRNGTIMHEQSVWITYDKGNNWKMIYKDSVNLVIDLKEPRKITDMAVTENGTLVFSRDDNFLLWTKNYGNSWDSLYLDNEHSNSGFLDTYKNTVAIYYMGTENMIVLNTETKDTNRANVRKFKPPTNEKYNYYINENFRMLNDSTFLMTPMIMLSDTSFCEIAITTNTGKTWEKYNMDHYVHDIVFTDDATGYACGVINPTQSGDGDFRATIDKTTDGGLTWENLYISEDRNLTFRELGFNGEYTIVHSSKNIISRSNDDWQTFENDSINYDKFVNGGGLIVDIECDNNGTCLALPSGRLILRNQDNSINSIIYEQENKNFKYEYISIYDTSGKLIKNINRRESEKITKLQNGVYLILYFNENNQVTNNKKILILN